MATTITAGNATNGLAFSADNTGILELKTGTGSGTTAMTIDASQVVNFTNAPTGAGTLTSGTAVTASGTSVNFTGIPSTAKRITVMFAGVSTNGTGIRIQLGDSGGIENTGYVGDSVKFESANTHTALSSGFDLNLASASTAISGLFVLATLGSNLWVINGTVGSNLAIANIIGGTKTLSDVLDRVRITTVNGTDTFDAGSINILYE